MGKIQESPTLKPASGVDNSRPKETWVCTKCKQSNKPDSNKCFMCGGGKAPEPKELEEARRKEEEKSNVIEKWTCEQCAGKMEFNLEKCNLCGTKKPAPKEEEQFKKSRSASVVGPVAKRKIVSQKDAKVQLNYTKNNFY